MNQAQAIDCPLCKSPDVENILNLKCGKFDNSVLYPNAVIQTCCACGHVYNRLSANDVGKLVEYYNEEYAPINMSAVYKSGNMPGGAGRIETERYQKLFDLLVPHINKKSRILDVGCAMGGFLDFLNGKGLENLSGIDLTKNFVDHVNRNVIYKIKHGSAESIPFEDNSFDLLVVNQVIEHLVSPAIAFKEAKRVLVNGGLLFLGVPDALRYNNTNPFDFYWLLIRDHIQHFDMEHLKMLAALEGFELVNYADQDYLALSEELNMPTLNVIFRLTNRLSHEHASTSCLNLGLKFREYISNNLDKLHHTNKLIDELAQAQNPLYAWGIGSEFLYLYENTPLKKCNLAGLIDVNTYKQSNFTVEGRSIAPPSILTDASRNAKLIITAIAYKKTIGKDLEKISYKGQIIDI